MVPIRMRNMYEIASVNQYYGKCNFPWSFQKWQTNLIWSVVYIMIFLSIEDDQKKNRAYYCFYD